MSEYTLDELYGCSIEEYCEALGKSLDDLIDEKVKEIQLLEESYQRCIENRKDMSRVLLAKAISTLKTKKRKHLKRFEKWSRMR